MTGQLVVLSGGLDSTVCMALAADGGAAAPGPHLRLRPAPPTELDRAAGVAGHYRSEHLVVHLDTSAWGGSALTDLTRVPPCRPRSGDPVDGDTRSPTCPPATASSWPWRSAWPRPATSTPSGSGSTPSTTPATPTAGPSSSRRSARWRPPGRSGASKGDPVEIRTPLIESTKAEIVRTGLELEAPLDLTWSCYQGGDGPAGHATPASCGPAASPRRA